MKCVICGENLEQEDLANVSSEFKEYPCHNECFDSFENADAFLKHCKHSLRVLEIQEMGEGWICGECLTENDGEATCCKECGASDSIDPYDGPGM